VSVIVTLWMQGDPKKIEEVAAANQDTLQAISAAGKAAGAIKHRFYGSDGDNVMVIDEWPDAESFYGFYASQEDKIGPLMAAAGITAEPAVRIWEELETGDEIG